MLVKLHKQLVDSHATAFISKAMLTDPAPVPTPATQQRRPTKQKIAAFACPWPADSCFHTHPMDADTAAVLTAGTRGGPASCRCHSGTTAPRFTLPSFAIRDTWSAVQRTSQRRFQTTTHSCNHVTRHVLALTPRSLSQPLFALSHTPLPDH